MQHHVCPARPRIHSLSATLRFVTRASSPVPISKHAFFYITKRSHPLGLRTELQHPPVQNAEQQRTAEMQIMKVKLSLQQISGLEDATRCYKCVGKAYISTQRGAVIDQMEATLERLVQGVEGHKATKARLEGNITSAEGEMKDFLQSNEALGRQYLASSAS